VKQLVSFAAAGLVAAAAWAQPAMTNGEVTKLDKPGGRITLKHGEIKNLDMPPMTMNFRVADPQLLEGVGVGDRVRFVAERVNGQFTITALSKTR
jgi:Cu/Ag efflux protein CusF